MEAKPHRLILIDRGQTKIRCVRPPGWILTLLSLDWAAHDEETYLNLSRERLTKHLVLTGLIFAKNSRRVFIALLLAWVGAGCDFPQKPRAVTISNPPVVRPSKPSDIKSLHEAMGAIIAICREELRVPTPDPIEFRLYENSASFASYGQGWNTLPIDLENFTAFTHNSTIHINLGRTDGEKWEKLVGLLAHEYGHAIEASISSTRSSRWFSEGFASWVAARVLHSLGWHDYALTLDRAKIELINNHANLKSLSDLEWHWQTIYEKRKGFLETYILAFFATARLIDRQGLPATLEYIKSRDFEKSFHMSHDTFSADFAVHLSSLIPSKKVHPAIMEKPEWKVGDQWTYAVKHPGHEPVLTRQIVREDRFEGEPSYVVMGEKNEVFRSKQTLERLAISRAEQIIERNVGSSGNFSWPLTLGKQWQSTYSRQDLVSKTKRTIRFSNVVSEISDITVPAGTFLSARVQRYNSANGRLMSEYWYSPKAKWNVKLRDFSDTAFREDELIRFKID